MKNNRSIWLATLFAAAALCVGASAASADDEEWAVFATKKDRQLEIRQTGGRIFVNGVDGDTVRVRARRVGSDAGPVLVVREQGSLSMESVSTVEKSKSDEPDPRREGLRQLTHSDTGLEIWTDRNQMWIRTSVLGGNIELHVDVPRDVGLDVNTQFADSVLVRDMRAGVKVRSRGGIALENVAGATEIEATGGWVYLRGVSGSIDASSQFGGIEGWIEPSDPDLPIALSAMGHIDIAIPQKVHATVQMKTTWGEVFTDFDMKIERSKAGREVRAPVVAVPRPEVLMFEDQVREAEEKSADDKKNQEDVDKDRKKRVYVVEPPAPPALSGSPLVGKINGGGIQIQLTTVSGNIYVRKKK